jgi:hypothetical protein
MKTYNEIKYLNWPALGEDVDGAVLPIEASWKSTNNPAAENITKIVIGGCFDFWLEKKKWSEPAKLKSE